MLDMPVINEVQSGLTDEVISKHLIKEFPVCEGQNKLCKVVSTPIGEHTKTVDCKETDSNNFNLNEVSESHSRKFDHEPFCVTGKDLDLIDIDDMF